MGVLVLPQDPEEAVRRMVEGLRPLLLTSDRIVVEGWQVRGKRPGRHTLVPVALIGALVALGSHVVPPTWKRAFAPRVPLTHFAGLSFPSGLDPTDRGIWLRLHLDGYGPLLKDIQMLPKRYRPHALDALGLARYSLLHGIKEGMDHARAV